MRIPITLPVSISSVVIQTSALGLIHSQPSSNVDFICICSYRIPCSFSVEDLPQGSKGSCEKAMVSCSFISGWNPATSHGPVLPQNSGLYPLNSFTGWCRALLLILSSTISHLTLPSNSDILCKTEDFFSVPGHVFHVLCTASRRFLIIIKKCLKLCTALFLFNCVPFPGSSYSLSPAFQP